MSNKEIKIISGDGELAFDYDKHQAELDSYSVPTTEQLQRMFNNALDDECLSNHVSPHKYNSALIPPIWVAFQQFKMSCKVGENAEKAGKYFISQLIEYILSVPKRCIFIRVWPEVKVIEETVYFYCRLVALNKDDEHTIKVSSLLA